MSVTGVLTIEFNKDMLVPDSFLNDFETESPLSLIYMMSYLIDLSVISSTDFEGPDAEKVEIESYEMISY